MRHILYRESNYSISNWTGGKTKELAIFPYDCNYLNRDFIWRLSSATIETEESDFSKLPDYDRVIMVLEGNVVLTYDGTKTVRLKELEQDSFDGGWKTKSYGKIRDFNLMVRKGSDGAIDIVRPDSEAKEYPGTLETKHANITHGLYCKEGYFVANFEEKAVMVNEGELLVLEYPGEEPKYTLMGEGVIIRGQIGYEFDYGNTPLDEPVIPENKSPFKKKISSGESLVFKENTEFKDGGAMEDLKWAFVLSNTQFRGARHIFRKLKKLYYDSELSERINFIEKFLATFIVYIVVILALAMIIVRGGGSDKLLLIAFAVWTLLDCLVISPIIYYFSMPKPIAKHIKNIDHMTEEEIVAANNIRNRNERLEKLLKKYSNSGRNLGRARDEDLED